MARRKWTMLGVVIVSAIIMGIIAILFFGGAEGVKKIIKEIDIAEMGELPNNEK